MPTTPAPPRPRSIIRHHATRGVKQGTVYDVSTHERTAPRTFGEATGHRPRGALLGAARHSEAP